MSLVKRIKGNLEFLSIDPTDEMLFRTKLLTIDGDLLVTGTRTEVESEDIYISDNILTLNAGETGHRITIPPHVSGIEIDRGTGFTASFRYIENVDDTPGIPGHWEATDNGTDFYHLFREFELFQDKTPQLGADLDVNDFSISSADNGHVVIDPDGFGLLKINSEISLEEQTNDAFLTVGYNKLYAKVPGSGGSGLFFKNTESGDELVSKTQAIVFSLIF